MTKEDNIFRCLEYLKYSDCSEINLVLWIQDSDSMEIEYKKIDINTIQNFIENAREKNDIELLLPIKQYGVSFFNYFIIKDGELSVRVYEGAEHFMDTWESDIDVQLPFLEIICKAIMECINTEEMCEKIFFRNWCSCSSCS